MSTKFLQVRELKFYEEDEGTFVGKGSVYGNVDSYGDVVIRGAFKRTIDEGGAERPLLWQHDPAHPIGIVTLRDTASALMVEGRLNLNTQLGRDVHSHLIFGSISGLSIGYVTRQSNRGANGTRELTDVELMEVSVVTFPANARARIVSDSVKAGDTYDASVTAALRRIAVDIKTDINLQRIETRLARLTNTLITR